MADPLSITGLALQIGALVKQLYDYGKEVKGAQKDIISLCGELSALKSVLDLQSRYSNVEPESSRYEFRKMLRTTGYLLGEVSRKTVAKSTVSQRAIQSLKWPFDAASLREKLSKLERLKTWFLLAFVVDNKLTSASLGAEMSSLTKAFEEEVTARRQRQLSTAQESMLEILAPVSPDISHIKACQTWSGSESGSWFCQGILKDWLEGDEGVARTMVLTGKSGSGKTTLMSHAVEEAKRYVESEPDVHLAHFYCAYNDAASQEARNVVGSWAAQIAASAPSMLNDLGTGVKKPQEISVTQLEKSLLSTGTQSKIILFLDALNESSEASSLVGSILRLTSQASAIKCLISSTPHLESIKQFTQDSYRHIDMTPQVVAPDIEMYIKAHISSHDVLSSIPAREITQTLMPGSEGMFRWVNCQMEFLTNQLTPKLVRRALHDLPGNLDETYAAMLRRVPGSGQRIAKDALLWLSFCQRPLTLDEVCEAVILEEGDVVIDGSCRLRRPEQLLSLCQGLVVLDSSTGTVALAHNSVRTFLMSQYIRSTDVDFFALEYESAVRCIVRKCLTYLSLHEFRYGHYLLNNLEDFFDTYPLLEYVSLRWALHARTCHLTKTELNLIETFFRTQTSRVGLGNFGFWVSCILGVEEAEAIRAAEPLYYAASYGLTPVVYAMLTKGLVNCTDLDAPWYLDHKCGRAFSTALQVACYRDCRGVVDLLLAAGANPNSTDTSGTSCIDWANIRGHDEISMKLQGFRGAVNDKNAELGASHSPERLRSTSTKDPGDSLDARYRMH